MPELPEVETIRLDLRSFVLNKKIDKVDILLPRIIKSDPHEFAALLADNSFKEIDRIGKLLVFRLKKPGEHSLLIHLRMTGQLVFLTKKKTVAGGHSAHTESVPQENKFTRVIIRFNNGDRLLFNDMRTFGVLKIVDEDGLRKEMLNYGIEPLRENFSFEKLKGILKKRRTNIKAVLLNQKLISGIGNIYADEILFRAGVSPLRSTDSLEDAEIKKIFNGSKTILHQAIKSRGTTFNNYVDAQGKQGSFLKKLKVYGRGKEKCLVCGNDLTRTKVAGRGTVYCTKCQA